MSYLMQQWDGQLWHAAGSGDLRRAREALSRGANVNVAPSGDAPLHKAAKRGDIEFCRLLVEAAADVSLSGTGYVGDSPLHALLGAHALLRSEEPMAFDVMSFLLDHGADPNKGTSEDDTTPLHLAACIRSADAAEAIQMLAQYGAAPNIVHRLYLTPLHRAAGSETWNIRNVRELLAIGADPGFVPPAAPEGYLTPFQSALRRGLGSIVQCYLIECGQRLDQVTDDGRTLEEAMSTSTVGTSLLLSLRSEQAVDTELAAPTVLGGAPRPRALGMSPI
jgi:ankyrin repeat protein